MAKKAFNPLGALLYAYLSHRLPSQQGASSHTLASYRCTFILLLKFIHKTTGTPPCQQSLQDWNSKRVVEFLDYLEKERACGVRTRNCRLAAIRAFMRYVAQEEPSSLVLTQRVLIIPMKRFDRPLLGHLSVLELKAILTATHSHTVSGRRDHLLLTLLYNTGARISEILALQRQHIREHPSHVVDIQGKGRKHRSLPLWHSTLKALKAHLKGMSTDPAAWVFTNRFGQRLSRSGVEKLLRLAVQAALPTCPSLKGRKISPHTIRHTTAMHLLQSNTDITSIALLLGHETTATTHQYVELDIKMKEEALKKLQSPSSQGRFKPSDRLIEFLEALC